MTTRARKRLLTSPSVMAGLLGSAAVVFTCSVAAQPRAAAPGAAKADAGPSASAPPSSPAGDAGAVGATTDAAAPSTASSSGSITGPESIVGDASLSNVPTLRKAAPPLPPPTPQQVAAYEAMKVEADTYEKGTRDYRDAVTDIITLHYEQKKKAILSGLTHEIDIESAERDKARETAIKRLQEFIAKYSGDNAQPEATPDAMFRLAALYEMKARDNELNVSLDKSSYMNDAIDLYRRIIANFSGSGQPNKPGYKAPYREMAGVYYFLGHALTGQAKKDEGQAVWRALVCAKSTSLGGYTYPLAYDASKISVDKPLKQNNTRDYWTQWRSVHFTPEDLKKHKKDPDTKYVEVYPSDCQPIPQPDVRPGEDLKYVAEIWWQIGNWEFENDDLGGGATDTAPYAAYDFNRAASAYQRSMEISGKTTIIYGVALYKYAWTLFKQERYEAAVQAFVDLLRYSDDAEKRRETVADFRQEAYTYIAGSLMTDPFVGPSPEDPYTTSEDIISKDPKAAEKTLAIAFDRVRDPKLVPQDRPWTIEVYRGLAAEYRAVNHFQSALNVYREMLRRWPMDPTAPDVQEGIVEVYESWAKTQLVDSPERAEYEGQALKARTELANYVGDKPWVDANKDNPAALQHAEELVRAGLRLAAEQHTAKGQQYYDNAARSTQQQDRKSTIEWLVRTQEEYRLAAIGWKGYYDQDVDAPDAYRSKFLLADALRFMVRTQVDLHGLDPKTYGEPKAGDIEAAKQAAIAVRDSDEDDQYLDDAAAYVVDMADVARDLAFQRYQQSGGTQGIQEHVYPDFPKMQGPDGNQTVVVDPIPPEVLGSMQARDEYVQSVPPEKDKSNPPRGLNFLAFSADQYFVYGHFKEARDRYEPLYRDHCGKDAIGYLAWSRLITMSNKENDADRSRQLAEAAKAKSCAVINGTVDEKLRADEDNLVNPTLQQASFQKARVAFEAAQQAEKDGKPAEQISALYTTAAGMYESALQAAPSNSAAPEAAINAAYSYKKIGNTAKAIDMYRLFIDKYGSEDILKKLETDKNAKSTPSAKGDPYNERVGYLLTAWEALSSTYYSFFDYRRAAESFAKIATNKRFPAPRRQNAAQNAMVIYASLGDRPNMLQQYGVLTSSEFSLPPEKRAEVEFRKADFDYSQWDANGPDSGSNMAARQQAQRSLEDYYTKNRSNSSAARFALEASYKLAHMMKTAGEASYHEWMTKTMAAWAFFDKAPFKVTDPDGKTVSTLTAQDWPFVDWVSECDYTLADEDVRKSFDYDTGHAHYSGTADKVKEAEAKDYEAAEKIWLPRLKKIADTYKSAAWAPAVNARIGSLFDTIRTGLDNAPFTMPTSVTVNGHVINIAHQIKIWEAAGQFDLADGVRNNARDAWNTYKLGEMDACNKVMVTDYASAAIMAKVHYVKDPTFEKAVGRLAFFTDRADFGDDKMRPYVEATDDPANPGQKIKYTNGMFLQWRAGQLQHPTPSGAPVAPPLVP